MSILSRKLMSVGNLIRVDDVFSTDIYTGNGSTQTITNGIDLAGEGGLAWVKWRSGASGFTDHKLFDTVRGEDLTLSTNSTGGEGIRTFGFTSSGFTLSGADDINRNGDSYAAWTFRIAPRFSAIVEYTGNGTAGRTIPHNLGVAPGMIVVKRRDSTGNWPVYHRSNTAAPETDYLMLNSTAATADLNTYWNDTAPTGSVFTVGNNADVNASGGTYVAYLFAHDPEADGVIQCGSYTGNGSTTGPIINLGWEPQWVLIKNVSRSSDWQLLDALRGSFDFFLKPHASDAEDTGAGNLVDVSATGFQIKVTSQALNWKEFGQPGDIFIYMAIRKEDA